MNNDIKQNIRNSYNAHASLRDRQELESWKQQELDFFLSQFGDDFHKKILDVGAGPGQQGKYLSDCGLQVTCIDLSSEMIDACKNKGLDAYVMDFYSIDFPEETFDAIWSMNALLHVPKKSLDNVLTSIKKVLKPEGIFYLGLYGGFESEGVWEEDFYEPKRFFSFYEHEAIQKKVKPMFELLDFHTIRTENMTMDYQAMVLKKR
ncbi:class I SAM-dependent methyltransferase [Paenibacillus sp. GCM10028914]|uniref:class I SAM-dependent methyltransferase n=1 Tax=Paenibacillus sp. GCM10028914 TaxID=3273416 RepID=UPI003617664F